MILFRTAYVEQIGTALVATFVDGMTNTFDPSFAKTDTAYQDVARWAGYDAPGSWINYAVEHELTHHWLADRLGWHWSWSLHDNPPQPWPPHVAWEEHLVNGWQRYCRGLMEDEQGILPCVVADRATDWQVEWYDLMDAIHEDIDWGVWA